MKQCRIMLFEHSSGEERLKLQTHDLHVEGKIHTHYPALHLHAVDALSEWVTFH